MDFEKLREDLTEFANVTIDELVRKKQQGEANLPADFASMIRACSRIYDITAKENFMMAEIRILIQDEMSNELRTMLHEFMTGYGLYPDDDPFADITIGQPKQQSSSRRNTKVRYSYDASDGVHFVDTVVAGELFAYEINEIEGCLDYDSRFVPAKVGLPENGVADNLDDHWFYLEEIKTVEAAPTVRLTAEEMLRGFIQWSGGWEKPELEPYSVSTSALFYGSASVKAASEKAAEKLFDFLYRSGEIKDDDLWHENEITDTRAEKI